MLPNALLIAYVPKMLPNAPNCYQNDAKLLGCCWKHFCSNLASFGSIMEAIYYQLGAFWAHFCVLALLSL